MAEAVLFSLATNILNSLAAEVAKPGGSFASQKIQLLCSAKDELQSLERTIQSIQAVLLDAEKQQWHNHQVKLWLKRLKDVLYDVQDLFDDVATENLRRKVASGNKTWKEVRLFFSKSNQLAHRLKVANKIQELRKTLDGIEKDKMFHLERHLIEETMAIGRGKKPEFSAPDEQIIGREEDKENVKRLLFDPSSSETVSFVSIVGKGGLGKTALARLVFHDREVEKHFDLKMWVCVSDVFDVKFIIKEILRSAKVECQGQDHENKPIEELQSLLRETLARKKYLLVLDDMWNEVRLKWLELGDWLKGGVRGSKILITTRSHKVAKVTDEKSAIYDLQGLPRDESWDLFREAAFGDRRASVDQRLEEMGKDIVRKCAGVPLAIRTVGSLLYGKKEDGWLRFKVKELPEIQEIDALDNGIMQVLKFSYDHLPSYLKDCFAYCSLFPKDCIYNKETMIQLWMAQGFIKSLNGEDNLEEIADNYLSDLLYRSFFDAETVRDDGEVLTFKMHDLMHDLARKVAGGECKIVDFKKEETYGGIRHALLLSWIFSEEKMMSLLETSILRTFFILYCRELKTRSSELDKVFSGLRHCRVLGLRQADIPLPPSSFGKLTHLRFLDVSQNYSIQSLPDSITDLVNLQTLKLSYCSKLTTLPRDLKKLVNLRHLLIDGCRSLSHMPCGLSHLSSLQTLSQFIVQKMDLKVPGGVGSLDELGGLNRLGGSIRLEHLKFLQPAPEKFHLREKQRLRSLVLNWSWEQQEDDESERDESILWDNLWPHPNLTNLSMDSCMSRSPPSWLSTIKNVVELELGCCGKWKYLPPLGELSSLRRLTLRQLDALEFVQEISDQEQFNSERPFFPSLEELKLMGCEKLKSWWGRRQQVGADQDHWQYDSHSAFPKLSVVRISSCYHLNSLPLFPRIKTLTFASAVCVKLLEQQVKAVPNYLSEAALSTSTPLSKLEHLEFFYVMDLEDSMFEILLPLLRNLEYMSLECCHNLRSLSHGMQYLSSLSSLQIRDCEELDLSSHDDEHGTQWRSLEKLCDLTITRLPKLVALPEGIQHVLTLQSLNITFCENLTSLPEWIGNFSSLQKLDVSYCSCLTCLPDGMRRLTSFKKLRIVGCPAMQEWCQRESRADWETIADFSFPVSYVDVPWRTG
ncbi:putative disease resistance protein RGA4 [Rhodamnia argentea]|uniref:Disease resistance protein RGA4 n=1 Tax=Rhodamnia argentea TaxID=178133 RepID=A0ABM3H9P7_9MYRT|nr:putative disease resistance protein RGA4 [Rhodamnia argentea]